MAIFAPVVAFAGRQLGRVVTTAVGWASTMLFGRVPQHRQQLLALMTLGSLTWLATLLGVVVPDVGTILIGFVPAPDFVGESWLRLAMLVAAIVLPLVIGGAGLFVPDASERATGLEAVRQVVRGYPIAFLLSFTLVFLAFVGGARKLRSLARRWSDAHIPIVVRPGAYDGVVRDLEDALDRAGIDTTAGSAPVVMSAPARLVGLVAGGGIGGLVPDRLALLVAHDLEIMVYPSDVALSGTGPVVARARAALASRLTASAVHLTTTKEAQEVEDRLQAIVDSEPRRDPAGRPVVTPVQRRELDAIDAALAHLHVDYDEWEVLYRMRLQVERDLLTGSRVGDELPGVPSTQGPAHADIPLSTRQAPGVLAIVALAIVTLDVALALFDRLRPPVRRRAD